MNICRTGDIPYVGVLLGSNKACIMCWCPVYRCRAPVGSTTRHTRDRDPGHTRRKDAASMMVLQRGPTENGAAAGIETGQYNTELCSKTLYT